MLRNLNNEKDLAMILVETIINRNIFYRCVTLSKINPILIKILGGKENKYIEYH